MTTPTIMIKSMITTVTTMMTSMVVAPPLWGVLVGLALLLLLTAMVVASSGVEECGTSHNKQNYASDAHIISIMVQK